MRECALTNFYLKPQTKGIWNNNLFRYLFFQASFGPFLFYCWHPGWCRYEQPHVRGSTLSCAAPPHITSGGAAHCPQSLEIQLRHSHAECRTLSPKPYLFLNPIVYTLCMYMCLYAYPSQEQLQLPRLPLNP